MSTYRYQMPAEWAKHEATWLTWPKNKITWPGKMLSQVENIYVQMIAALVPAEIVHLLVPDRNKAKHVLRKLASHKIPTTNLRFHYVNAVDTWIRDYGPIFVSDHTGRRAFTKWTFNAWGGKYSDLARDNNVVNKLNYLKSFQRINAPMILEGGSIDTNGEGICLTTRQCLLNKNRNAKLTKKGIEKKLVQFLGFKKIIWLNEGIEADDTDGHVDDITRFVGRNRIITAIESCPQDPNYQFLHENLEILRKEKNLQGKSFEVIELPMPGFVGPGRSDTTHRRLPASYANFYIGNYAVLLPVYSHANDKKAIRILKRCFPGKKIATIECSPLVYGLGSIHCVTQQQPA